MIFTVCPAFIPRWSSKALRLSNWEKGRFALLIARLILAFNHLEGGLDVGRLFGCVFPLDTHVRKTHGCFFSSQDPTMGVV